MDRLTQLREYMEKERLDAFYIAKPANVRCISGFTGEDSFLFITKANQYFITDARYTEQASYECPDYELVNWRINFGYSMGKAVAYCADKDGVKTIGFEQDHLTFEKWNSMQTELSAEMVPTLNVIEGFRAIKTPEEIKNLTVACDIASRAFEKIIKDIRPDPLHLLPRIVDQGCQCLLVPTAHCVCKYIIDLALYRTRSVLQHMCKRFIFPVNIRQKMFRSFWKIHDCL